MEKEFIPYEQALDLLEMWGDEDTEYTPMSMLIAPLYQQAFRWFREEYNLDKVIDNWAEQSVNGEIWSKAYQYYINGEAYTLSLIHI